MSLAGTYFTSWEFDVSSGSYQLGPIIVISSSNAVTADGVTINGAMVTSSGVSWSSSSNNPSSAVLQFSFSTSLNAMTFNGEYWPADSTQPSATNIWGFATQPSAPLSSWNDVYYCYESSGNTEESAGQIVISAPTVMFAGRTINNPVYTGLDSSGTDTTELAWYTSDGNENNVAISFFDSTSEPGVVLFNGNIWAAGAMRPMGAASSVNNFYGTTQSTADAAEVNQVANLAQAAENAAVNYAVQQAVGGNQQAADDANENEAADDDAAADAGDDAAADAAGDAAADAGGDAALDVAAEVGLDLLVAALLAVEPTPDAKEPVATPPGTTKTKGLSAKELAALKETT